MLFGLKYESRDDFLAIYSKAKRILYKLKKGNSVTVTDDVFFKDYFEMVIEAPELQTEVRGFLKDITKTYTEILDEFQTDYRVHAAEEDVCGVPGGSMTTSDLVRRATVDKVKSKKETDI